jgi:hypothetical protein
MESDPNHELRRHVASLESTRIKTCDAIDAAVARLDRTPKRVLADAAARNRAETGDDNTPSILCGTHTQV